jgi:hypothetical protein
MTTSAEEPGSKTRRPELASMGPSAVSWLRSSPAWSSTLKPASSRFERAASKSSGSD